MFDRFGLVSKLTNVVFLFEKLTIYISNYIICCYVGRANVFLLSGSQVEEEGEKREEV